MLMQVAVMADDFGVKISGKLVDFLRNVHGISLLKFGTLTKVDVLGYYRLSF